MLASAGGELTVRLPPPPVGARPIPATTAVAWAADGTVEAMETPGERFLLGVQWHPEVAEDAGLFRALVRASQA